MKYAKNICEILIIIILFCKCIYYDPASPEIDGKDIKLTVLHTTDIHSRLIPYYMEVMETDERLGLVQKNAPFGGASRIAYIIKRERMRGDRVIHLDSGDPFQGAPIFNFFHGEAEIRFLSLIGVDAMAIGNHEFDLGGLNLYHQLKKWATFPALSANYLYKDPEFPLNSPLGEIAKPFVIKNVRGLRIGIIGMANLSSMHSIYNTDNRLGVTPLNPIQVATDYINLLRSQCDVILIVSHLGLHDDEILIKNVPDIDAVFGGHHHIVLNPPKKIKDPHEREVYLIHSGAFAKYVGKFEMILRQCNRIQECIERYTKNHQASPPPNEWEVISARYTLYPIDRTVPEDPIVKQLIEEYQWKMEQLEDLTLILGYAPKRIRRFGSNGGDSMLGNLVAQAIWLRHGVQTDFSMTNSLGIRADFSPGPVTLEMMYNVFPFENTITTMFLSGIEIQELFDYIAWRSGIRGCNTQVQIAGAAVELNCGDVCPEGREECKAEERRPRAKRVMVGYDPDAPSSCSSDADCRNPQDGCFVPKGATEGKCMHLVVDNYKVVDPYGAFQLATNDYIASGGSGFRILGRNTTQNNTGVSLRKATIDYIRNGPPCTENRSCTTDNDCNEDEFCACDDRSQWTGSSCSEAQECIGNSGHCVLKSCVEDISEYYVELYCGNEEMDGFIRCSCVYTQRAMTECQFIPCINEKIGAVEDGRIRMISP